MTILAYRRRRGWGAWTTATLGRFEFKDGYPSLESTMGRQPRRVLNQDAIDWHHAKIWARRTGARATG